MIGEDSATMTACSPDLGAFAYTEVEADRAGPALLLDRLERHADRDRQREARLSLQQCRRQGVCSRHRSGAARAGQGKEPHPGRLPARDRALVLSGSRSRGSRRGSDNVPTATTSLEALRTFALAHDGDPKKGEAIFFDGRGVGCVRCHAAAGRGELRPSAPT